MGRRLVDRLPVGAVSFDRLRRQVRTGLKKFRLPADELDQYIYISLFKMIVQHPLISYNAEMLWDKLLAGEDIVLLPDTLAAADLAKQDPASFFIVSGVENVNAFVAQSTRNFIVNGEVKPGARHRKAKEAVVRKTRPTHRRARSLSDEESEETFASLEWLAEQAAARNSETRDEELAVIRARVLSRFSARQAKVIELTNQGHAAKTIPGMTGYSLPHVYKILDDYVTAVTLTLKGEVPAKGVAAERSKRQRNKS